MRVVQRPTFIDYLAPDGSEIRLLKEGLNGGLCECTLGPGAITQAVAHKVVEENWYVISGRGRLWRKLSGSSSIVDLAPGDSVTIPVGTEFQFKADGSGSLVMLLATIPIWEEETRAGGPDASEGQWLPKPPPVEFTIQGNWWQLALGEDASYRLAHMRLARIGSGCYELAGQSFTEGWVPRAEFEARDAHFSAETRVLRYDWSGRHVDDVFAGAGQVLFVPADPLKLATGYYDVSLGMDVSAVSRVNVLYSRLRDDEDLETLRNDAASFGRILRTHFAAGAETHVADAV